MIKTTTTKMYDPYLTCQLHYKKKQKNKTTTNNKKIIKKLKCALEI